MTDTATGLTDAEAAEFRQKCVDFMEQFAPGQNPSLDDQKAFLAAAAEAGLAGLPVPTEYGGGGKTLAHEKIWREVKGNYPMPDSEFIISHGMCMPMLAEYGTHEQKERFLADNISGKTMWCQMFSEPGAGSDVASLQTKAELDGDEWVINGQKVWTTLAHKSDYGLVVARTDPDQVKHAGISMFILDMRGEGVEIRPIHQIDGGSHFNEVFFADVRIPKDWLIGDLNNGWNLATAMLMYERVAIGGAGAGKINQPNFKMLRKAAESTGKLDDPVVRDQLMQIWSMETCKSLVAMKTRDELKAGKTPGPGGSLGKLFGSNIAWQRARDGPRVRRPRLDRMGPRRRVRRRAAAHRAQQLPVEHRRRHRRDPAQHHRRPRPGPAAANRRSTAASPSATSRSAPSRPERCDIWGLTPDVAACSGRRGDRLAGHSGASRRDEIVERAPRSAEHHRSPTGANAVGRRAGERGGLGVRRRDDCNIDIVFRAEPDQFVRRHVRPEVLHRPVVVAERHRRHRGRQRVEVTADGRNQRRAPAPPPRVGGQLTEDPLDDR